MAQQQKIVQNPDGTTTIYVKPDIIGIFGEIVGCVGGIAVSAFAGVHVAKAIGPVTTTIEKVGKTVVVASVTCATEYYVSEGIAATFNGVSETSDKVKDMIRGRSQQIVTEVVEQPVPAQQQGPKRK